MDTSHNKHKDMYSNQGVVVNKLTPNTPCSYGGLSEAENAIKRFLSKLMKGPHKTPSFTFNTN